MAIDPAQNKALRKTSASDSERLWKLLPRKGYASAAGPVSAAPGLPSRAWLRPFLSACHPPLRVRPRLLFPFENSLSLVTSARSSPAIPPPPLPRPVRSAHEYQCTCRGASGTAWYLAGLPAPSRSSSPATDAEGVIRSPGR